jgi:hypothetical protein
LDWAATRRPGSHAERGIPNTNGDPFKITLIQPNSTLSRSGGTSPKNRSSHRNNGDAGSSYRYTGIRSSSSTCHSLYVVDRISATSESIPQGGDTVGAHPRDNRSRASGRHLVLILQIATHWGCPGLTDIRDQSGASTPGGYPSWRPWRGRSRGLVIRSRGVQGRHCGRVLRGDRTVGQVARDFDLTETAVRAWVKQARLHGRARSPHGRAMTRRMPADTLGAAAGHGPAGSIDGRVPGGRVSERGDSHTGGMAGVLGGERGWSATCLP